MTFKEFNDLVGEGKPWGKARELEEWQRVLYRKAQGMIDRCYNVKSSNFKNYGAIGTYVKFEHLSDYVAALEKDPCFRAFKTNPHSFVVDKDEKCMQKHIHPRYYGPDTVKLTTCKKNSSLVSVSKVQGADPVCWCNGKLFYSYEEAALEACTTIGVTIDHANGFYVVEDTQYTFPHRWYNRSIKEWCECYAWTSYNINEYDLKNRVFSKSESV